MVRIYTGKSREERERKMAFKNAIKNKTLKLTYAAIIFTILSVSYVIVPDKANLDVNTRDIDCSGLLASQSWTIL